MKYNLEQAIELTGSKNEEQFLVEFAGRTAEEINDVLIQMFGQAEGDDMELAEEIVMLIRNETWQ